MSHLRILLALASAAGLVGNRAAATELPDTAIAARADRYLTARAEIGGFSGAVLIARNGRVLFRKGYGFADLEKRVPYTPGTRHEVASVSKMFTAMAALKLRDQGRLALDDPIGTYLDDCPEAWRPITVSQLLHHTSGIPDYEERLELGSEKYLAFMTRREASAEIFANALADTLEFVPGTKFHYSNTGYVVLSRVIERAAGRPFAAFVRATLLEPAGMSRSGVLGVGPLPRGLAHGYTSANLAWDQLLGGATLTDGHLKRVPQLALTPPAGDAWLFTTVDDLYRWSLAMEGGALIPPPLAAEALTPGLNGYAAGWFVGEAFGQRRARHNGFLPGYATDFIRFPDAKVTLVILCNVDNARMSNLARDLSSIVFDRPWDLPVRGKTIALAASDLIRLEGEYRMNDSTVVVVRNEPDYLTASIAGRFTAGLIPLSPTVFYMPMSEGRVTFALDANGRGSRINLRYSGEDHVATRPTRP